MRNFQRDNISLYRKRRGKTFTVRNFWKEYFDRKKFRKKRFLLREISGMEFLLLEICRVKNLNYENLATKNFCCMKFQKKRSSDI